MTKQQNEAHWTMLWLLDPGQLVLPALDHGERARCRTLELVADRWPSIVALAHRGEVEQALAAMEQLACDMHAATQEDPEPWQETLVLARSIVYDSMHVLAAQANAVSALAREPLARCAAWDRELYDDIIKRLAE